MERVKNISRRVNQIESVCSELDFQSEKYDNTQKDFKKICSIYGAKVTKLREITRFISPKECRYTLYKITKYYPDTVYRTFPWYIRSLEDGDFHLPNINFGAKIIKNYEAHNIPWYQKIFCCTWRKEARNPFLNINEVERNILIEKTLKNIVDKY